MLERKRTRIDPTQRYPRRVRAAQKIFPAKCEINGPSNTSLYFSPINNPAQYKPWLTPAEKSWYFSKAIQLYDDWAAFSKWRTVKAEQCKLALLSIVSNLLALNRTTNGCKVRQALSLKVSDVKGLQEVILIFRKQGYINFLPGYSYGKRQSALSKIWPTIKFDELFLPFTDEYEANLHITCSDSELVRIKRDDNTILLNKSSRRITKGLVNKLRKINQVNQEHKIMVRQQNLWVTSGSVRSPSV